MFSYDETITMNKFPKFRFKRLTNSVDSSQMPRDWEEVRISVIRPGPIPTSSPCGNTIPNDDRLTVLLPSGAKLVTQVHARSPNKTLTEC